MNYDMQVNSLSNKSSKKRKRRNGKRKTGVIATVEAPVRQIVPVRSMAVNNTGRKTTFVVPQRTQKVGKSKKGGVPLRLDSPSFSFKLDHVSTSTDGSRMRVKGRDWIQSVQVSTAKNVQGAVLVNIPFGPNLFSDTRMEKFATLYERYNMNKVRIEFNPNLATTFSGRVCGFIDYDVNDQSTAVAINIRQAYGHQRSGGTQISYPKSWTALARDDQDRLTTLYTCVNLASIDPADPSLKWYIPFRFWLLMDSPIIPFTDGMTIGDLTMSFDLEMFQPQLQSVPASSFGGIHVDIAGSTIMFPLDGSTIQVYNNSLPILRKDFQDLHSQTGVSVFYVPDMAPGETISVECFVTIQNASVPIASSIIQWVLDWQGCAIRPENNYYYVSTDPYYDFYRKFYVTIRESDWWFVPHMTIGNDDVAGSNAIYRIECRKITPDQYTALVRNDDKQTQLLKSAPRKSFIKNPKFTAEDVDAVRPYIGQLGLTSQLTSLEKRVLSTP